MGMGLFAVGLLLCSTGALRSFTTSTLLSLGPLQMSDSKALRALLTSCFGGLGDELTWRFKFISI